MPPDDKKTGHDIVVVGASAGGVEALRAIVSRLPSDLPAAVFVVLHVPAIATSVLPAILQRAGDLPAAHAEDGAEIERGRIYIAPPDHHLLIQPGFMRVHRGPKENGYRPAVDPMFRTDVLELGGRRILVDLTGTSFMDSTALGVLVGAAKALRSTGGQMVLVADDPRVTRVIEITGLERVFRISSSLPEAVQQLVGGSNGGG